MRRPTPRVVYEADGVIVVDKPAGLPTSGRTLDDPACLQSLLIARQSRMVWAVHQLDADTSGLNVFVQRRSLVPVWQARLKWPTASKTYVAIVHGRVARDEQLVDVPIGALDAAGRTLGVTAQGRPCQTEVTVVERGDRFSVVLATLRTGRTHQVRIHLAHIGHPLVGEPFYGRTPCELLRRHALHALRIAFDDQRAPALLECAPSPDLVTFARSVGLTLPNPAAG